MPSHACNVSPSLALSFHPHIHLLMPHVAVHEGIQVRVDITRSEQMLSQPTQTSTMRTNVFKVPSDVSDDDDANKETLDDYDQDEADDLHKLLDEDEPVIVSAARKFPFSKFHILDATHSSGISQHNPVVIDDEDSLDMPQAQAGSAAHEMADSVDSEFAEFDTDDSEIEYGDDEDHVSIKSGPASPRHGRSFQRRAEAYLTDEDSDEDFTPNQPTEVEASVPETEPATGPPQLDVVSPKLFPADRTLPNPEAFKTGSIPAAVQSTDQGNVLPPIGHLSSFSPGNPSMTTQMAWDYQPEQMAPDLRSYSPFSYMYNNSRQYQSSYPGALSNSASYSGYGQRFPATMPNKAMPDYSQDFTNAMPKSTTQQQSMFEAAEVAEPVFDKVDSPVEAEATLTPDNDGESRKRKRADEDVAEAEEADEAEVDDAEAGDEAVIDPTDLTMKRGARVVKLRVRSIDQGSNEVAEVPLSKESDELTPDIVEEQVTEPVEMVPAESVALLASNMGTKADEGRPAKRARTSSVGLALTAAAGAFGGCVATVGFFWSPLAEKLLT